MHCRLLGPRVGCVQKRYFVALLVLILGCTFQAFGQEATIVGTVTDPSGAAVANAKITATRIETGLAQTIATSDNGDYVLPSLKIGHYNVKAEASGFKVSEEKDVVLQVGDRTRLDFHMQVGGAAETVTVEANAVQVQTDSGEVSNVIIGKQMSQMAINGRSIYQLAALTPGASSLITGIANVPVGGNADVEFNGQRRDHNIYLLDGGEDYDRGGSGNMSIAPSTDAIAEFRALTSNYSADYGLSSAATMTMVLKSGTSTIHASAWEFNRNDAFDARDFFTPAPAKVPKLRLNVFGFNVGGPVTFGKLYNQERKKTFFFYNMEWRRLIQGNISSGQQVPLPSTYGGNFGSTVINVPTAAQVADSVLFRNCPGGAAPPGIVRGQAFPSNTIPACMLDPNAQALVKAGIFPAPTTGNRFFGSTNAPTNLKEEVVRIDHNFNSKFSVFGHFIAEQVSQGFSNAQWSGDNVPTVGDTFVNPSYSAVVHTAYVINPRLINEIAFNYNGNRINITPFAGSGLASLALPSGYTGANSRIFTGPNNLNRIPNIDLKGSTGTQFEISSWPWKNKADDYQIRDDLSWTKGAHQLKFGFSWALYKKVQDLFGTTQGSFNFDGTFTGNDFADMLLGTAKGYSELGVQDSGMWNNVSWAAYVQDNWRVNNRLTLNLGLRWDGVPHTYEANNRHSNFYPNLYDPAKTAIFNKSGTICSATDALKPAVTGCAAASPGLGTSPNPILAGIPLYLNGIGIAGQNGVPKGLVDNHWTAFGPRLGFAYDLTGAGKTVLRGGFGIMYERIQGNDMYDSGTNIPFSFSLGTPGPVLMENPTLTLATGVAATAATFPINPADVLALDRQNYRLPRSYQWSLGVQRSLSSRTVLSMTYVGNTNRFQNYRIPVNLPALSALPGIINGGSFTQAAGLTYRGFRSIRETTDQGNTHYNGLQFDLNSQVGKDLFLRAFYTYSRTIDFAADSRGPGGSDLSDLSNPYLGWRYDLGPSGFDRTHNAVVDFVYSIPFLRNSSSRLVKTTLGGWEVSGIVSIQSGVPINANLNGKQGDNGIPNAHNRPNLVGKLSYPNQVQSGDHVIQYLDPSVFAPPAIGTWGNFGHYGFRGPGRHNWNLALFKSFVFSETRGSKLEFRAETFNVWNHTQFREVKNGVSFDASGKVNNDFGRFSSTWGPRIMQLGAKLYF